MILALHDKRMMTEALWRSGAPVSNGLRLSPGRPSTPCLGSLYPATLRSSSFARAKGIVGFGGRPAFGPGHRTLALSLARGRTCDRTDQEEGGDP